MDPEGSKQAIVTRYLETKSASYRRNFPYSYYVLGQFSYRLTPWFIDRQYSANFVTALSFVVLLLALGSVGAGALSPWFVVLGGLLLHVVLVLDNIDGCIAQSTGTETAFGSFADAFVAWFHYTTLPLCLGFAVSRMDPEWWHASLGLTIPGWIWIGAGVARSLGHLFTIIVSQYSQKLLDVGNYDERLDSTIGFVCGKTMLEAEVLMLVIAPMIGVVGILHLGYAVLYLIVLTVVIVKNIGDLRSSDRKTS